MIGKAAVVSLVEAAARTVRLLHYQRSFKSSDAEIFKARATLNSVETEMLFAPRSIRLRTLGLKSACAANSRCEMPFASLKRRTRMPIVCARFSSIQGL